MSASKRSTWFTLGLFTVAALAMTARGQSTQPSSAPVTRPAAAPSRPLAAGEGILPAANGGGMIRLNFPDNVEVKVLVEYVSQRLGINILYDEQIGAQKVTIKAPTPIPNDSLLGVLDSALRMKGLALLDDAQPGWKRIITVKDLVGVSPVLTTAESQPTTRPAQAVTQVFVLKHVEPQAVSPILKPFLSTPGGNSFEIPAQRLLVVTDYQFNLARIAQLIDLIDAPGQKVELAFLPVEHLEATQAASEVMRLLGEKQRAAAPAGAAARPAVTVSSDPRTNRLIVIGSSEGAAEAREILQELDVPLGVETKVYQFTTVSPDRVEKLAKELVDPAVLKNRFRATVDREAGLLIVTAPAEVHAQIEKIKKDMDLLPPVQASPIRIYKLLNTTASEVLATIQALVAGKGGLETAAGAAATSPLAPEFSPVSPNDVVGLTTLPAGPNYPPALAGQQAPPPPAYHGENGATSQPGQEPSSPAGMKTFATPEATVTADANTNSIIVMAPPPVQAVYEQLIRMLDRRRPQVLVEFTLVTLDTSNGCSFGVDLATRGTMGATKYLLFNSFGLSTIDTATGNLAIKPGMGFNGALLDPGNYSAVVQALASSTKSKVLSAPRILVNDNASGSLASIAEAPFTSINASQTVSTTSFAGYASAGTTVTVTPHIGEGEHLQLKYTVTLNSFGKGGGEGIPPPRQTDTINSEVTVPNGYTVVVGGLTSNSQSETLSGVPGIINIPILKYLFGNTTQNASRSTLFVFIRPIILRDDEFEDLKYLSDRDIQTAGLPAQLPSSEPIIVD